MSAYEPRTVLVVDRGPCLDAALILCEHSTLSEHVDVRSTGSTYTIEHGGDGIPYDCWGSGTQALWRLLSSIAYSSEQVSLYQVVSRLDRRNTAAVAAAVRALCGEPATGDPAVREWGEATA